MKVLCVASQKGGAGKTTLAAHLAVAAEAGGRGPVVMIDTDPQGSLTAWWNSREAPTPALAVVAIDELGERLAALSAAGIGLVVIDTPPALTDGIRAVVEFADLVVIPVKPSPHDLRAVGQTVDIAAAAGKPFVFAVSQGERPAYRPGGGRAFRTWCGIPRPGGGSRGLCGFDGRWQKRIGDGTEGPRCRRNPATTFFRAFTI